MKQGIFELSSTPIYPIGKRFAPDERAFRYAQIYGQATLAGRAVANLSTVQEAAVAAANSAIGANTVTITVQATAGLVEDELKGGYLCYAWFYRHRIKSHPAAENGATCVLTLETAIVGAAVASGTTTLIAYHNPWRKVGYAGGAAHYGDGVSFVGMPFGVIAIGQYTWVQTWGPCTGVPAAFFGDQIDQRQVWFDGWGGLTTFANPATDMNHAYQHAGFWIPCTYYGGALHAMEDGGHLLFLQITP